MRRVRRGSRQRSPPLQGVPGEPRSGWGRDVSAPARTTGEKMDMNAEEKLDALAPRIAAAARRAAEARRMEARIFTAEAQGTQRTTERKERP